MAPPDARRRRAGLAAAVCLTVSAAVAGTAGAREAAGIEALGDVFRSEVRPVLEATCIRCHGGDKTKADVNLAAVESVHDALAHPRMLEDAADQLETGEMPPEDEPDQPTEEQRRAVVTWIRDALAAAERVVDPGPSTLRRLNRAEYRHTIRDLFGVDFDPSRDFPADGSGGAGFDNNADALFLPPVLMEHYLDAATEIIDRVFADESLRADLLAPAGDAADADPGAAADRVLERFLSRAFRRPCTADEISAHRALFDGAAARGETFEAAIRLPLRAALVSPHFLFRVEDVAATDEPYRVAPFELASRLSYFLWSSMPDAALFHAARSGELESPEGIGRQVERMLDDPKSRALARQFAGQWLGFAKLVDKVQPDESRFPEFTPEVRAAMFHEAESFFHHLVADDRPLLDLVDSDYTFVNGTLARHYGIAGVDGPAMRRVSLAGHPERGGVLGMGAILTATSLPLRTSPVIRGKWVLEDLLGDPPPPTPQNVGTLPADDRPEDGLTFRQQLERHRDVPRCAGCHAKIDPIGFGLENFDPVGRWRTESQGSPIDATGRLPDGTVFRGPSDLKEAILARRDEFARNVTEKMLAFALGRELRFHDRGVVRDITGSLAADGFRTRTLIRKIATSYPFLHRRGRSAEAGSSAEGAP